MVGIDIDQAAELHARATKNNYLSENSTNALLAACGNDLPDLLPDLDERLRFTTRRFSNGGFSFAPWSHAIHCGCDPVPLIKRGIHIDLPRAKGDMAYSNVAHPFSLAILYFRGGMKDRAKEVVEHQRVLAATHSSALQSPGGTLYGISIDSKYFDVGYRSVWDGCVIPVSPETYGLPRAEQKTPWCRITETPWYTDATINDKIRSSKNYMELLGLHNAATSQEHLSVSRRRAEEIARGKGNNVSEMSTLLNIVGGKAAHDVIGVNKGVRAGYHIVIPNVSTEYMILGLKATASAGEKTRSKYLEHIARCPTAEEVRRFRSTKIIDVIHDMPWEILQEQAENKEFVSAVQAVAMRVMGKYPAGKITNILKNHNHRLMRSVFSHTRESSRANWETEASAMWGSYTAHRNARHSARLSGIPWGVMYFSYLAKTSPVAKNVLGQIKPRGVVEEAEFLVRDLPNYNKAKARPSY